MELTLVVLGDKTKRRRKKKKANLWKNIGDHFQLLPMWSAKDQSQSTSYVHQYQSTM